MHTFLCVPPCTTPPLNRTVSTCVHAYTAVCPLCSRMAMQKKAITAGQKLEIIASIESGERQASVCKRLDLAKTTVSSIWRGRDKLKRSLESGDFGENSMRFCPSNHKSVVWPFWHGLSKLGVASTVLYCLRRRHHWRTLLVKIPSQRQPIGGRSSTE